MGKVVLGVVAAMPQEIAPLLQRVGRYGKKREQGFTLYRFELQGTSVGLIESGMGPLNAAAATRALISLAAPSVILSFGFAGGVTPDLKVGDLVRAERVLRLEGGVLTEASTFRGPATDWLQQVPSSLPVKWSSFITASAIMNKKEVAALLGDGCGSAVLEMETAAVFETAAAAEIPALALRGISDAASEELGFSLEEFCDDSFRIRVPRVLGSLLRKPWIVPQLMRLAGNSRRAGKRLAKGVEAELKALAAASRLCQ